MSNMQARMGVRCQNLVVARQRLTILRCIVLFSLFLVAIQLIQAKISSSTKTAEYERQIIQLSRKSSDSGDKTGSQPESSRRPAKPRPSAQSKNLASLSTDLQDLLKLLEPLRMDWRQLGGPKSGQDESPALDYTRDTAKKGGRLIDWWGIYESKSDRSRGMKSPPVARPHRKQATPSVGTKNNCKAQLPNQNPILTARNQLMAIRAKHILLVKKSVSQLVQLDERLIESHKLCLKHKHPLFGGMLIGTRHHLIQLAKDVRRERVGLEAMAKGIQTDLKERMLTNKTLLEEYRSLARTSSKLKTDPEKQQRLHLESLETKQLRAKLGQRQLGPEDLLQPEADENKVAVVGMRQKQQMQLDELQGKRAVDDWPRLTHDKLGKRRQSRLDASRLLPVISNQSSRLLSFVELNSRECNQRLSGQRSVHVSEAKLEKQLGKTQALIDRIGSSVSDIHGIIDDMLVALRIIKPKQSQASSKYRSNRLYEGKQARKTLKSPVKNFKEKHGSPVFFTSEHNSVGAGVENRPTTEMESRARLTAPLQAVAAAGSIDAGTSASVEPLFDSSSLVYHDTIDPDLGFD